MMDAGTYEQRLRSNVVEAAADNSVGLLKWQAGVATDVPTFWNAMQPSIDAYRDWLRLRAVSEHGCCDHNAYEATSCRVRQPSNREHWCKGCTAKQQIDALLEAG